MNKHLILMLEYDEDDQYITREHFKDFQDWITVEMVTSSEELLDNLKDRKMSAKVLPSLLLLNYNSTPKSAPELLNELKSDIAFRHIPVVVLSGTVTSPIVKQCYSMGANSFIQKPALVDDTSRVIRSFIEYWFRTVELPLS
jgi:CheY-like chemotaxis protein